MWWVGTHERKKGHFLYSLFCPKEFFNIWVLSQSLVYWIHFYTSKNITSYTFFLVFKIIESLQYILKLNSMFTFSIFNQKYPFWGNLVQKLKIVSLGKNLVFKLIHICRIQWWYSLVCIQPEIPSLSKYGPKN